MTMSRKDYIKIANVLRAYKARLPRAEFDALVMDLAMVFQRDNERFSATRFGQYIYGGPEQVDQVREKEDVASDQDAAA